MSNLQDQQNLVEEAICLLAQMGERSKEGKKENLINKDLLEAIGKQFEKTNLTKPRISDKRRSAGMAVLQAHLTEADFELAVLCLCGPVPPKSLKSAYYAGRTLLKKKLHELYEVVEE